MSFPERSEVKLNKKTPIFFFSILIVLSTINCVDNTKSAPYLDKAARCLDILMEHGTDRYGPAHTPVLVSILDVKTWECPEDPLPLDQYFRVTRRERRNPAGANLLTDQPMLRSMLRISEITGDQTYSVFSRRYMRFAMENLVGPKGLFWWGWHRHYDVFQDTMTGHDGNHHEIHAITAILWDVLWDIDPEAVRQEIEAIWKWHVIDKKTGEVNRHSDGQPGCDFSMSAGAYIEAFVFLYDKTRDSVWLDRACLLADYYWDRRNLDTNLIPERPNAGGSRFDGRTFTSNISGLYCYSLLKAYERTGKDLFKNQALAYLRAYYKYGFDPDSGKFWGALNLNGEPVPGPRIWAENIDSEAGYAASQPRGHLDLWEPYAAGYQYAIYTAQCFAYAYALTKDPDMYEAAEHFAEWIMSVPTDSIESENTWYRDYSTNLGQKGTYAGKYGRSASFFIHMYTLSGKQEYKNAAGNLLDEAAGKLSYKGLFRGHPGKSYYEAIDGVGYLTYALLQFHQLENSGKLTIPPDNW
jgi:hypothetical protein